MSVHIEKMTRLKDPTEKLGWGWYMEWRDADIEFEQGDQFYFVGGKVSTKVPPRESIPVVLDDLDIDDNKKFIRQLLFSLGFNAALNGLIEVGILHMENKDGERIDVDEDRKALIRGAKYIKWVAEELD